MAVNDSSSLPADSVTVPSMETTIGAKPAVAASNAIRSELFRLSQLRRFLTYCRDNFAVLPLRAINDQPALFLRHDVDLDLEPALQLARFESECGVSSTFFVQLTSLTYNALTEENRVRIREIHHLGFEIGLHFDCAVHPEGRAEVAMMREAEMLADIVGEPIRSVSLHAPSVTGKYPLFPQMLNAYDPAIFGAGIYLSDSCMRFRHDPWIFVEQARRRVVQLLLHPLHFSAAGDDYSKIIRRHHSRVLQAVDKLWRINEGYRANVLTPPAIDP